MSTLSIAMAVGPAFEDLEFWAVALRILEEGWTLTVLGSKAGETYSSKSGGLTAKADRAFSEVSPNDFSALLVPGGWAPDKLRRDRDLLRLVREMDQQGKILGFICHAGWVAISAGIMAGRPATGSEGIRDDIVNAGGIWRDEPAFRDGNRVWGRVVADIPLYNRHLVQALREVADNQPR